MAQCHLSETALSHLGRWDHSSSSEKALARANNADRADVTAVVSKSRIGHNSSTA
jgi:hypothetical protein